jgi:hypothetical protein
MGRNAMQIQKIVLEINSLPRQYTICLTKYQANVVMEPTKLYSIAQLPLEDFNST